MKMVHNIKEHKQTNLQLLIFWENDKVPTKVGVSLSLSPTPYVPPLTVLINTTSNYVSKL